MIVQVPGSQCKMIKRKQIAIEEDKADFSTEGNGKREWNKVVQEARVDILKVEKAYRSTDVNEKWTKIKVVHGERVDFLKGLRKLTFPLK